MNESRTSEHLFGETTEDFIEQRNERYFRRTGMSRDEAIETLGIAAVSGQEWGWIFDEPKTHPVPSSVSLHKDLGDWDKPYVALEETDGV